MKLQASAVLILFLYLSIGGYLFHKNLGKKLVIYENPPLYAVINIFPSEIKATEDISQENHIVKTALRVKVTNDTVAPLTQVFVILPSIGLETLESTTAKRITNLPQQGSDDVFSLGTVQPKESKEGTIFLFSTKKKVYTIKARVETAQQFSATSNSVILNVK